MVRLLCLAALTLAMSSLAACRTTEDMLRQIPPEMLEKALGPDGVRKLNAAWAGGADTIRWIVGAAVILGILLFALFTDRPRKIRRKPVKKPRRKRKR
jgi:hypothetical protein